MTANTSAMRTTANPASVQLMVCLELQTSLADREVTFPPGNKWGARAPPSPDHFRLRLGLENQSQPVLNFAAVVSHQFSGDLAKVRVVEVDYRVSELDPVKDVVGLCARLDAKLFG